MAANYKTVEKIVKIFCDEVGSQEQVIVIVRRLLRETVPSGNHSYDATIERLNAAVHG